MASDVNVGLSVTFPGEALAVAIVNLISKAMDSQPPDVKAQMWQWFLQDYGAWRDFWAPFMKAIQPKT